MDLEYFKEELEKIEDEGIRNLTTECLKRAPSYFWYKPASSTGKYHHPDENEFAGLLLHTKRVHKVACILVEAWDPPVSLDIVQSASLLHDIKKYGEGTSQWTVRNHPELGAAFILKVYKDTNLTEPKIEVVEEISNCIRYHMGRWGASHDFKEDPKAWIVHLADYIATQYIP